MKRGFYTIMAAQFFSSLADNALLIAAIALLVELHAPTWMQPLLKLFFTVSYVVLAPFVGAFADSLPKGRVMLITNSIKVVGCALMFFSVHPLLAYAVVGFGAAAYSPAKYGILTELLPPERLVAANGWIEGTTVGSIILGVLTGGALIDPRIAGVLLGFDLPGIETGIDSPAESAIIVVACLYAIAAAFNFNIPDTGARYPKQHTNPFRLISEFARCNGALWRDKLGQISLAVTTLFWGAGATLQFIVLKWAEHSLGLTLSQGAYLQAVVAFGIAFGAIFAAAKIPLRRALSVLPVGVMMGLTVPLLSLYNHTWFGGTSNLFMGTQIPVFLIVAGVVLVLIGAMAGFFVVPMNALLQHRGHVLLSAGHSIAVQNFNENLNVLIMLGLYALLLKFDFSVNTVIVLFGAFVAATMAMVMVQHQRNQKQFDSVSLIASDAHH